MPDAANGEGSDEAPPRVVEARVESHVALPAEPHVDAAPAGESSAPTDHHATHQLTNSRGWDGKLRIDRRPAYANPEALSDPDYSDEDNVLPGEKINADEGIAPSSPFPLSPRFSVARYAVLLTITSCPDLLDDEDPGSDEINLIQSRIASIPQLRLERFTKVARLCLRQNLISKIAGLSSLAPTLNELDLYDNLISHVRGLDELTDLTTLDLSFNKIKHIKNVDHLTKLTTLYFVSNKISRIEGLDTLVNLTEVELGSNRIREIQNLDSLKNLEQLWLAKNKITELKNLGGLPKLKLLSIQSNRITDLSPLRELPQLEELYISHNALESLEGLEYNTNLHTIDIANNMVKSLKGVGGLKNLAELWASSNQLSDFADVERELKDKSDLTTVYFEANPLQLRQPALYRNKVRLALPQVKQIDATFVKVT
ncbi:protein phosphatase 1 regulatory subunit SDS22 [Astrocystis sublimbata]|nr:protein phosphatase 1 regulatory subunit SDS22 [Astrocystis sublimbata]